MLVLCNITKESFLQWIKGELTTDGGAIRWAEGIKKGQIKELPQIQMPKDLGRILANNFALPGIDTISGVMGNLQMAHLQKSVNVIDKKVDTIIHGVTEIRQIACLNTVLSGASLAASVAGNAIIINKLSNMERKLDKYISESKVILADVEKIKLMLYAEKKGKFEQYIFQLKLVVNEMKNTDVSIQRLYEIGHILAETGGFLYEICESFRVKALEMNPEGIFRMETLYFTAVYLFIVCCKLRGRVIDRGEIDSFNNIFELLISNSMQQAVYTYYYNNIGGIPLERDLIQFSSLPQYYALENYNLFQFFSIMSLSTTNLNEYLAVEETK